MNALKRFLRWLAGRSNSARIPDPLLLPRPPVADGIPYDAELLARAALVAGDKPRALLNLRESIQVGMPGHDVGLLARARIDAQAQIPDAHQLEWGALAEFDLLETPTDEPAPTVAQEASANGSASEPSASNESVDFRNSGQDLDAPSQGLTVPGRPPC